MKELEYQSLVNSNSYTLYILMINVLEYLRFM